MRIPDSLYSLVDHGIIEEVVRPLMSGKEAQIYLVVSGGEQRVAKIYKEAQNRTFQNRADYIEGRKVRNSRDQRAMGKGSRHGRAQNEAAWRSTEVDMIYRLRQAGVRVPEPYHFIDGVLIMELVTDAEGFPAPRLGDLTWEPADAVAVYQQLLAEVVRMLSAGVVHGDLSDFNVLMSADGPVIIDLPQAVDASSNQNARKLLLRDVDNLHRFLAKYAPGEAALPYAEEMWELYTRNALTPDTRLTGRYRQSHKAADTQAVMGLIADAARDDRRRREHLGLTMRGAASASIASQAEPVGGRAERPQSGQASARPPRGAAGPARPRADQGVAREGRPPEEVRGQRDRGPLPEAGRGQPRHEGRSQHTGGRTHAGQRPPQQPARPEQEGGRFGGGQREPRQQAQPEQAGGRFGGGQREPRQQAQSEQEGGRFSGGQREPRQQAQSEQAGGRFGGQREPRQQAQAEQAGGRSGGGQREPRRDTRPEHDRGPRPAGRQNPPHQQERAQHDGGPRGGGGDDRPHQAGMGQQQRAPRQHGGERQGGHEGRPQQAGAAQRDGGGAVPREERPLYDRGPRHLGERSREVGAPRDDAGAAERAGAGSGERHPASARRERPREPGWTAREPARERTKAAPAERVVHGFGERVARAREVAPRPADGGSRQGEHAQGRASPSARPIESSPPRQRGDGGTGA